MHGRDYQEAREHAMGLEAELGLEAVPPFHPDLVVGVGTYALELFDAGRAARHGLRAGRHGLGHLRADRRP